MTYRVPDSVQTLLLDMNGTFVFGHDRFGPDEDYYPTYRAAGGEALDAPHLNAAVRQVVARLDELYGGSAHNLCFPSVATVACDVVPDLGSRDLGLVEMVIARHEMGTIADDVRQALSRLADRFSLGVVSNLWSVSAPWREFLDERLGSLFVARVFSSDLGINKPAAEIFRYALTEAGVDDPGSVMMVGDDWRRDVEAALALGMQAAWISEKESLIAEIPRVRSVTELR